MLQSNKLNLIISIVAAIVIWAYVITVINPTDERVITNVPVELINLESLVEDQLTISPAQTYTVDVVVRGTRSDLSELEPGDLKATANLKGFYKGTNSVDVVIAESDEFTVSEVRPQRIDIVVEDFVTATKPIRISYTEKFPQDSQPGFVSLSPQEIEVGGTKEQIDSVSFVEAKVNSTELNKEATTLTVDAVPMKSNGDPVYNLKLSQQTIDVTATLCKVKEVPLAVNLVGDLPEGIGVTKTDIPKTIFIRGEAERLANINEITAQDINIGSLRETTIITPELNLPAHVELADASRDIVVTIEVEGVEAKNLSYTVDQIEITGLEEGYSAHVNNVDAVTATIFGNKEQVGNFKSADLKLYVDLKNIDYTMNSAYVDVQFKYSKDLKRVGANPVQVQVVVEKNGGGDEAGNADPGVALAPQE